MILLHIRNIILKKDMFPMNAIKAYTGSGGTAPLISNLGTGWRYVANYAFRSLYRPCGELLYPLNRRLGGAPEAVWAFGRR
jgi:hypothetical protein